MTEELQEEITTRLNELEAGTDPERAPEPGNESIDYRRGYIDALKWVQEASEKVE